MNGTDGRGRTPVAVCAALSAIALFAAGCSEQGEAPPGAPPAASAGSGKAHAHPGLPVGHA
ncbi:hypothetical protein KEF29_21435 [Streptomyces tuirus]|uniref:Lipoprotein n=1 Tax=Streptomyces tuirus TaxID=68278 RepID=A0A941FD53_9ACTN|nr:hypothetical protein [Streptomyces tuirus]